MTLNRFNSLTSRRGFILLAVLALVLSQAMVLDHSHNGDLQPRMDCHLCFKLGTTDDGIPVSITLPSLAHQTPDYRDAFYEVVVVENLAPAARAPPRLS